ncbi:hypothetical protein ABPG75_011858 [Micractinium tetrahymenae]
MNPGGGGGGSGEVAQPARSRAVGARLSKVEANALSVAFRLPADLADENVKLLRSGHPTKMRFGDLSTLKEFLIDVTDMLGQAGVWEMHAVKIATFGGKDYYSHMLKRPLEGLKRLVQRVHVRRVGGGAGGHGILVAARATWTAPRAAAAA